MNNHPQNGVPTEPGNAPGAQADMLQALSRKRADLTRQLSELDAIVLQLQREYSLRLSQLQARKKPLEDALHHVDALLRYEKAGATTGSRGVGDRGTTHAAGAGASVTDAAFDLLEEYQPMHYREMAARLQERNIYVPGKDPAATLLSRMSRDGRFKRVRKRGMYALSTGRARGERSPDYFIDDHVGDKKGTVRNGPPASQAFVPRHPWSHVSLFASGISYGS